MRSYSLAVQQYASRHTTFLLTFYIILFILCNVYGLYYKWSMKTFSTFHINRSENVLTTSIFIRLLLFAVGHGYFPPSSLQPAPLPRLFFLPFSVLLVPAIESCLMPSYIILFATHPAWFLLYWIRYDFKCFFILVFCCYFHHLPSSSSSYFASSFFCIFCFCHLLYDHTVALFSTCRWMVCHRHTFQLFFLSLCLSCNKNVKCEQRM